MTASSASLWPSLQTYIERTAEQARTVLQDAVFQQAWTHGMSFSVDEAVAMAMALREPPEPSEASSRARGLHGAQPLSLRELDVARLVARGFTNKQIAACLVIAERTAERHVANIFDKLGVSDRLELALYAIHNNLHTGR